MTTRVRRVGLSHRGRPDVRGRQSTPHPKRTEEQGEGCQGAALETTNEPLDPLMDAVMALRPIVPRESHERRVRRHCHALLAARRQAAPPAGRLAAVAVAAAVALYLAAMVSEAVRLAG